MALIGYGIGSIDPNSTATYPTGLFSHLYMFFILASHHHFGLIHIHFEVSLLHCLLSISNIIFTSSIVSAVGAESSADKFVWITFSTSLCGLLHHDERERCLEKFFDVF